MSDDTLTQEAPPQSNISWVDEKPNTANIDWTDQNPAAETMGQDVQRKVVGDMFKTAFSGAVKGAENQLEMALKRHQGYQVR